ncbi:unnamed protein product [Protopolystoma xenopodis]|uniref:Uncharacterized protein n=1 Tax=Protopolystoma xenopodis TaxID=117903 RepID=A0A3S5CJN0_9PLAT|nr:unnamed protein product [Protopolystoma xenopodis]
MSVVTGQLGKTCKRVLVGGELHPRRGRLPLLTSEKCTLLATRPELSVPASLPSTTSRPADSVWPPARKTRNDGSIRPSGSRKRRLKRAVSRGALPPGQALDDSGSGRPEGGARRRDSSCGRRMRRPGDAEPTRCGLAARRRRKCWSAASSGRRFESPRGSSMAGGTLRRRNSCAKTRSFCVRSDGRSRPVAVAVVTAVSTTRFSGRSSRERGAGSSSVGVVFTAAQGAGEWCAAMPESGTRSVGSGGDASEEPPSSGVVRSRSRTHDE